MIRSICALTMTACAGVASADMINFAATINGDQNNNDSPATGTLDGVFDSESNSFTFSWEITDNLIGDPAEPGAHIHEGAPGVAGPIVLPFDTDEWDLSGSAVWTNMNTDEVIALMNGDLYVNFHTTQFPGGEVRGQIEKVPAPGGAALLGLAGFAVMRRRR